MTVEELAARQGVVDTITRLLVSTDRRDWTSVAECFADSVQFDMTSLVGGAASTLRPAEITAAWQEGLAPIQAVHHQAGNFQVQLGSGEASATCYAIAYHYRKVASGRNTRMFVGSYDFHLLLDPGRRWRIDLFRFHVAFVEGNLDLHSETSAG